MLYYRQSIKEVRKMRNNMFKTIKVIIMIVVKALVFLALIWLTTYTLALCVDGVKGNIPQREVAAHQVDHPMRYCALCGEPIIGVCVSPESVAHVCVWCLCDGATIWL